MREYVVILEQGKSNWSAYAPDLPGCVATGPTREDTLHLMREAIEFHIEGMRQHGESIPEPRSDTERVAVLS